MEPNTCKEWRGKRVILTRELRTPGGDIFHPRETLVVRRAWRDGTFEPYRPTAALRGDLRYSFILDVGQRPFNAYDSL